MCKQCTYIQYNVHNLFPIINLNFIFRTFTIEVDDVITKPDYLTKTGSALELRKARTSFPSESIQIETGSIPSNSSQLEKPGEVFAKLAANITKINIFFN